MGEIAWDRLHGQTAIIILPQGSSGPFFHGGNSDGAHFPLDLESRVAYLVGPLPSAGEDHELIRLRAGPAALTNRSPHRSLRRVFPSSVAPSATARAIPHSNPLRPVSARPEET